VNVFTALFSHLVILTFLQIVPWVCVSLNWLPIYLFVRVSHFLAPVYFQTFFSNLMQDQNNVK
jgi:hypothetical protein